MTILLKDGGWLIVDESASAEIEVYQEEGGD
jgi:hypothetical protein